jgi:4-amino-4-deoxy-L-arabinose transferase-like glycosyltransferase/Tfp pilus assembly protein PilF
MASQTPSKETHDAGLDDRELSTIAIGMGIFVGALLLRLLFLYDFSDNPTFYAPIVDAQSYDTLARDLAEGGPFQEGLFWQPILYPVWLSLVYELSDSSILFAKVHQAIIGALTCLLTYLLAHRLFYRRVSILAGIITACYGPLLFFESQLVATGWASFWSVALLLLFVRAQREKNLWVYAALGICGALAILTRPTFLPFFLIACGVLMFGLTREKTPPKDQLVRFALLVIGFALFTLPVALLNQQLTGRFGILPSSGGINLFIGNNPDREETLSARPGAQWQAIAHLPIQEGQATDAWQQQDYFVARVKEYAITDSANFLKGIAEKTLQFLSSRETPRNIDLYEMSQWSNLLRTLTWKVSGFGFPFGVLLPLAFIGLGVHWKRLPAPFILFPFIYAASVILVFVTARYRAPIIPVLSILGAAGVFALTDALREKSWHSLRWMGGVIGFTILVSTLPGPFTAERQSYSAEMYREVAIYEIRNDRPLEARALFRKSIELDPESAEAHSGLAQTLYQEGRNPEAKAEWERAVALNPNWFEAVNNLAWLLATAPQEELREPERALQLAQRACAFKGFKDPSALDTLAAAQASTGNYSEAIATLNRAMALIEPSQEKDLWSAFQERKALYQNRKPFIE